MYTAAKNGLIQGHSAGELGLDKMTTRAESVTMVERILTLNDGGKLVADKYALSTAELALKRTNIFTVMPEFFGGAQGDWVPWNPNNLVLETPDGKYKAQPSTSSMLIDVGDGKLISKIIITTSDNQIVDVTPPGAENSQTWVGSILISGDNVSVYSSCSSTQGYYAWDRYMIGDPHGTGWYESGGSCPSPSSSSKTESINGAQLPVSPKCTDTGLTLYVNRKNPYRITATDTTIPSTIVDDRQGTILYTWSVDVSNPIDGPLGLEGHSDYSITKISVNPNGVDNFIVHYSQAMDHPSGYETTLADPDNGSRQMVYFAAFTVDIASKTYIFPDHIDITYKDAPTATNLTGRITAADACIQTGKAKTFTYTVANNGSKDVTTTVTGRILVDGTQLQSFWFPMVAAGVERTGTFNYAFQVKATKIFTISIDQAPGEPDTLPILNTFWVFMYPWVMEGQKLFQSLN